VDDLLLAWKGLKEGGLRRYRAWIRRYAPVFVLSFERLTCADCDSLFWSGVVGDVVDGLIFRSVVDKLMRQWAS
jgi:hypothetical protein